MDRILVHPVAFPQNQLYTKLEANSIKINLYAEQFFSHPKFSTEIVEDLDVVITSLKNIGLPEGGTFGEIINKVSEAGLKPCPANAGLFLRLAWMDQSESNNSVITGTHSAPDTSVTVLSSPLCDSDDFPKGLYLRNVDGVLWLRGYICDKSYRFSGDDMFAFLSAR